MSQANKVPGHKMGHSQKKTEHVPWIVECIYVDMHVYMYYDHVIDIQLYL